MIKEALQWLSSVTHAEIHNVGDLPYTDKPLTIVEPHLPEAIEVETLGALVRLVKDGIDGITETECFVQVNDYSSVDLHAKLSDKFGRRRNYITAAIEEPSCPFVFGRFMEPEVFIISLQAFFVEDSESKRLLALVSSLQAENVATAEDDGISQTATTRQGISMKTVRKVDPKITLRPFRTFREVKQPSSIFLFRLQNRDNQPPLCALFEADGGAWKLEAVEEIATHLAHELSKKIAVVF